MPQNLPAPIALFVYNRLDHTRRTIESLQKNFLASESELFIFCDNARNYDSNQAVQAVREYVKSIQGFKNVTVIERDKNLGLAQSIISGVGEIVTKFGRIIVLEDDMVTSPHFLEYMNEALDLYETEEKVISIHGYIYPTKKPLPETFFLRGADCWGWATWKRGWDIFEKSGPKLLQELQQRKLTKIFDFDGCYPYTRMLEDQISGKNNSWAIRWYAAAFLADKLTLYPGKSLVQNIGIDGSGTHCADMSEFDIEISQEKVLLQKIPLLENASAREKIKKFFKPKRSFIKKIIHRINKKRKKRQLKKEKYGWFTTNLNWSEAKLATSGYDDKKILEKCKTALLKVKTGEAVFERDSVLFNKIDYSWPVLAGLLLAAAHNGGKLDIIDFGGSLGSHFFQNRKFLNLLSEVHWNIVEQANFVECSNEHFQELRLKSYSDIESCLKENQPNILLLSSVVQYLEKPYQLLDEAISRKFQFIIFDLTGFHNGDIDLLTIQKVWPEVYQASYPCWFFSKTKFFEKFAEKYELVEEFISHFGAEITIDEKPQAQYRGAIFKLKSDA